MTEKNSSMAERDRPMRKEAKQKAEKKPRRRWHERTAEQDIRYRGPLNYQHFQILGWLCIVAFQAVMILNIGQKMGKLPDQYEQLRSPLTFLSLMSLPFLLLANFAQIMNGRTSYKTLLLKNFYAAAGIWGVYALIMKRYIIGTIDLINDGTVSSISFFSWVLGQAVPEGVLSFNIFVDLFLCVLVMFFLNYRPKRIFRGKSVIVFRLFALLPIAYEVASIVLKVLVAKGRITVSPFLFPLFTVKPPMTFVLFIILAVYIKTRELRYRRHGKTHEEYKAFLHTRKNSLDFSVFLAVTLVLVSLADYFVFVYATRLEMSALGIVTDVPMDYQPIALTMGFGNSIFLFLLAPLVLLFSYTREPWFKNIGIVIPVVSFALILLLYLEAGHQAIPMFNPPKINLDDVMNPPPVEETLPEGMSWEDVLTLMYGQDASPAGDTAGGSETPALTEAPTPEPDPTPMDEPTPIPEATDPT